MDHPSLSGRPGTQGPHAAAPAGDRLTSSGSGSRSKVRNQVRKGQKRRPDRRLGGRGTTAGILRRLQPNMRDLGTPVYRPSPVPGDPPAVPRPGRVLRRAYRPETRRGRRLLLHGWGVTEVPSASSLRELQRDLCQHADVLAPTGAGRRAGPGRPSTSAGRAPERPVTSSRSSGGRSPSRPSGNITCAAATPRTCGPTTRDTGGIIRLWQRLPVGLTRFIGPSIVRGIP